MNYKKLQRISHNLTGFLNFGRNNLEEGKTEYSSDVQLVQLSGIVNDEPSTSAKSSFSRHLNGYSVTVEGQRENSVSKWTITNCRNLFHCMEFFEKFFTENLLQESESVIVISFKIDENFSELKSSETENLNEQCQKYSVIIYLVSKNEECFKIYWKSNKIEYFLTLSQFEGASKVEERQIYEFLADFFVSILKNGHLGLPEMFHPQKDSNMIQLHLLADSRGYNLLLCAAESGKCSVVNILLKMGINSEQQSASMNAQTLAYEKCHFDVLLLLLKENLTYPETINIEKCSQEVKEFYQISCELHEMIKDKNTEKVEEIVSRNPKIKHFYNLSNESALTIAVKYQEIDTYVILINKKITFGPHEDIEAIFGELSEDQRRNLREIHFTCSKDFPEKHLNILIANSFLSHDETDEQHKYDLIIRAYRNLNKDKNIKIILQIVAASKEFSIIFDFNRVSVLLLDPTATSFTSGSFYLSGRIYIGAKELLDEATENVTYGVLAHEFCHYAMQLTYKNDAKPYKKKDVNTKIEFDEISAICEQNKDHETFITYVYEWYPCDVQHAELIVRAAHLFALYANQSEKLEEVNGIFNVLFQFYVTKTIPDMKAALPLIEEKVKSKAHRRAKFNCFWIFLLFGMGSFGLCLWLFLWPSTSSQLLIKNSRVSYKNLDVRFRDLFSDDSLAYKRIKQEHVSLIQKDIALNFSDPSFSYLKNLIFLNWGNLTESLKSEIKKSKFYFQGQKISFRDFFGNNFEALESISTQQMTEILNDDELKIGYVIKSSSDFYIDRSFVVDEYNLIYAFWKYLNRGFNFEEFSKFYAIFVSKQYNVYKEAISEIVELIGENYFVDIKINESPIKIIDHFNLNESSTSESTSKSKNMNDHVFILSSPTGSGKSTVFEKMAELNRMMFPKRWESIVNLKNFTNFLENYNLDKFLANSSRGVSSKGFWESTRPKEKNEEVLSFVDKLHSSSTENVHNLLGEEKNSKNSLNFSFHSSMESLSLDKFLDTPLNSSINKVLNFLQQILNLSSNKNSLEWIIFEYLYKMGKMDLFWDGFSEISVENQQKCLTVMKAVQQESKIIQYVSIRAPHKKMLSEELMAIPYKLVPFSDDEVYKFLDQQCSLQTNCTKHFGKFVDESKDVYYSSHDSNFDSPSKLSLFCVIYCGEENLEGKNLYEILSEHTEKVADLFSLHLYDSLSDNHTSASFIRDIVDLHQKFALKSVKKISSAIKLRKLKIMRKDFTAKVTKNLISNMGLLHINSNKDFSFTHEILSNFFVAQYFVEKIYNTNEELGTEEAENRLEIFFLLFIENPDDSIFVIRFLKLFLEIKTNEEKTFNPTISKLLRTKYKNFLVDLLPKLFPEYLSFLINFFKKDIEVLQEMLRVNDEETFYTAIFNPSYQAYYIDPVKVKNITQQSLQGELWEKFTTPKNQKGKILFGMFYYKCSYRPKQHDSYELGGINLTSVSNFIEDLTSKLSKSEFEEVFPLIVDPKIYFEGIAKELENPFSNVTFDDYKNIWSNYGNNSKNIKAAFGNAMRSFLEMKEKFQDDDKFLPSMIIKAEEFLKDSDILEVIKCEKILFTVLLRPNYLKDIWNFISNHTNDEEKRQILLQNFYDPNIEIKCHSRPPISDYVQFQYSQLNLLHMSFIKGSNDPVENIFEKYFNKSETQEMISSNEFLIHLLGSKKVNLKGMEKFCAYMRKIFEGNKKLLKNFLLPKVVPTNLTIFEYFEDYEANDVARKVAMLKVLLDEV